MAWRELRVVVQRADVARVSALLFERDARQRPDLQVVVQQQVCEQVAAGRVRAAPQRDREAQRAAERARRERERTDGAVASFEQVCETRQPSVVAVIARQSNGVTLLRCEVSDSA